MQVAIQNVHGTSDIREASPVSDRKRRQARHAENREGPPGVVGPPVRLLEERGQGIRLILRTLHPKVRSEARRLYVQVCIVRDDYPVIVAVEYETLSHPPGIVEGS